MSWTARSRPLVHHGAMSSFDERARSWDTPERRARAEAVAAAIRSSVTLDQGMRVIDVGAGTGLLGVALAADVGTVVLADPSAGMHEVTREKLAAGGPPNATAMRLDLVADPPPGEPFDLAVSMLVLHHLPDPSTALAALHALLRPGGRLALADLDEEDGSFHDPDAEGIHHRGFERSALAELARGAGFKDVEMSTATVMERDGREYPLFLLVGRRP
jgi:2-polyprenyl-3-methyl-5-hydroxy-6-metoxy-1,4-benzoquinol methylase